jgi:hypothetical protein
MLVQGVDTYETLIQPPLGISYDHAILGISQSTLEPTWYGDRAKPQKLEFFSLYKATGGKYLQDQVALLVKLIKFRGKNHPVSPIFRTEDYEHGVNRQFYTSEELAIELSTHTREVPGPC